MKSFKVAVSLFLFSSASAVAADLPSIKSEPSAAPAPMWVGFHAGLNAGGTWGNNSGVSLTTWDIEPQGRDAAFNIAKAASAQLNSGSLSSPIGGAGFIGGGQIGYDWQVPLFGLGVV